MPTDRHPPAVAEARIPLVSTHTHTNLSLCGHAEMTFDAVVGTAARLGYELLVLCDHVHVPTVTNYPRHLERLAWYRQRRAELQPPLPVVIGAEFEVTAAGCVVEPEPFVEAAECAIVAPNHYQLDWVVSPRGGPVEAAAHELDHLETAIAWPHTDVVAHPFAATGITPSPDELYLACDQGRLRELLVQAVERDVALEIQPKYWFIPERAGHLTELFETWLGLGGKVALGSDAHRLSGLQTWSEQYQEIATRFGLDRQRLWWPASEKGNTWIG
ncbi:MAG: PHP domain-containing protein [Candidatus Latescibacterota bacterium]